jgi:predicted RNA methylase
MHNVFVTGLLPWIDAPRLLGPGAWVHEGRTARTTLVTHAAADLAARLHNVAVGGSPIQVEIQPPLARAAVRAARTTDARRRRDTTPGFTRPGARLDPEGKVSLTPEVLALELGQRFAGRKIVDATCGAGGNTIGFARAGCRVVAIELDAGRLADARHNARLYGVDRLISFVHGDALRLAAAHADPEAVLFLDPPWGVDWLRSGMGVADLPLLDAALSTGIDEGFHSLVAKVPPSFRVSELPDARPEAVYGRESGDSRRVKYLILMRRRAGAP